MRSAWSCRCSCRRRVEPARSSGWRATARRGERGRAAHLAAAPSRCWWPRRWTSCPPYIQERLENVAVLVEERPADDWSAGLRPDRTARAVRGHQPPRSRQRLPPGHAGSDHAVLAADRRGGRLGRPRGDPPRGAQDGHPRGGAPLRHRRRGAGAAGRVTPGTRSRRPDDLSAHVPGPAGRQHHRARARRRARLRLNAVDIRAFATDRHRSTDDYPVRRRARAWSCGPSRWSRPSSRCAGRPRA